MHIKCTYDLPHLFLALVALWEGDEVGLRQWAWLVGWLVSQSLRVFQVGGEGAESTEGPGEAGSSCVALSHHRCLSNALYMAKPSTAKTVAPTLALSQKVEFFRSA